MARGTGPKRNPNKITIGDGSIRDLAYWLMGGDLPVKRGRKKVSAASVRNETKKIIPTILKDSRTRADKEKYGPSYNPLTDYSGKYSPEQVEERNRIDQLTQNRERIERDRLASYEQAPLGEFYTGTGNPMYQSSTSDSTGLNERMPMYGRRKATPTQPMVNNRTTTPMPPNRPVPLMSSTTKPIKPIEDAYEGDPEFFGEGQVGFNMGGYVQPKKKKKKKKMYGGKMKKYAKGGGIRKPKYS